MKTIEQILRYKGYEKFVFTFGMSHKHSGNYIIIFAKSFLSAREIMFQHYERKWAFQYTAEEWEKAVADSASRGQTLENSLNNIIIEKEVE